MTDKREVQALTLLTSKKGEFRTIPNPELFNETYESCKDRVTQTLTGTQKCIKSISTYVQTIHHELEDVRKLAKDYNIQMGDYLKKNLPKLLDVVWVDRLTEGTRVLKSSDVSLKQAKIMHEMELLVKQQNELMELILNTENLITKVETEAELSLDDFNLIKGSLKKWTDSLETEKERQQREREERERIEREKKRKEEEERMRIERKEEEERIRRERKEEEERLRKEREEQERKQKEEDERKRIEEEKRRKEEEERRRQLEKIKRNPDNWKPMM